MTGRARAELAPTEAQWDIDVPMEMPVIHPGKGERRLWLSIVAGRSS